MVNLLNSTNHPRSSAFPLREGAFLRYYGLYVRDNIPVIVEEYFEGESLDFLQPETSDELRFIAEVIVTP